MKKVLASILSALMLFTLAPAVFAQGPDVSVSASVTSGAAAVEGNVITLIAGTPATIQFTPSPGLDPIDYQYGTRMPAGSDITDATPFDGDTLIPTYTFGSLAAGSYTFGLYLTKNSDDPSDMDGYITVFDQDYTVNVVEIPNRLSIIPTVKSGTASISGSTITLKENTPAIISFTPGDTLDSLLYQASFATDASLDIQDVTPLEDTLAPTYAFGALPAGEYEFTLSISENIGYSEIFGQTFTLKVERQTTNTPGVTVVPQPGTPAISLSTSKQEMINMALTADEIAAGYDVKVVIKAATPSQAEKDLIKAGMGSYQEGIYLDLSLYKTYNGQDTLITSTAGKIRYTITIPEQMRKEGRSFAIFRNHDGVITKLADLDDDPHTYTFETDAYSTYALGYQDTVSPAEQPGSVIPQTGDSGFAWVLVFFAIVAAGALTFLVRKRISDGK